MRLRRMHLRDSLAESEAQLADLPSFQSPSERPWHAGSGQGAGSHSQCPPKTYTSLTSLQQLYTRHINLLHTEGISSFRPAEQPDANLLDLLEQFNRHSYPGPSISMVSGQSTLCGWHTLMVDANRNRDGQRWPRANTPMTRPDFAMDPHVQRTWMTSTIRRSVELLHRTLQCAPDERSPARWTLTLSDLEGIAADIFADYRPAQDTWLSLRGVCARTCAIVRSGRSCMSTQSESQLKDQLGFDISMEAADFSDVALNCIEPLRVFGLLQTMQHPAEFKVEDNAPTGQPGRHCRKSSSESPQQ